MAYKSPTLPGAQAGVEEWIPITCPKIRGIPIHTLLTSHSPLKAPVRKAQILATVSVIRARGPCFSYSESKNHPDMQPVRVLGLPCKK